MAERVGFLTALVRSRRELVSVGIFLNFNIGFEFARKRSKNQGDVDAQIDTL
jgi:hypothetical protein